MFTHPDRPAGGLFQPPKDTECSSVSTDFTWKLVLSPSFALVTTLEYEMAIMKNHPVWENFCGGNKPPFIQSSGRFLWVEFVTDRTRNEKGFHATYTNVGMKFVFTLFKPSSDLLFFLQSYLVSQNPSD